MGARRITEYQKEHNEAASDISAYVSNPINAYLLTKRLTSDWRIIEQIMIHDVGDGMYKINRTYFRMTDNIIFSLVIIQTFFLCLYLISHRFALPDVLSLRCCNRNFGKCHDASKFYEISI